MTAQQNQRKSKPIIEILWKSIKINEKAMKIKNMAQLYCFIEVVPQEDELKWARLESSLMSKEYEHMVDRTFKNILLTSKDDIWPAFSRIFGGKIDE